VLQINPNIVFCSAFLWLQVTPYPAFEEVVSASPSQNYASTVFSTLAAPLTEAIEQEMGCLPFTMLRADMGHKNSAKVRTAVGGRSMHGIVTFINEANQVVAQCCTSTASPKELIPSMMWLRARYHATEFEVGGHCMLQQLFMHASVPAAVYCRCMLRHCI
jgi:hypothetical protein